jgi:hypothetical protein
VDLLHGITEARKVSQGGVPLHGAKAEATALHSDLPLRDVQGGRTSGKVEIRDRCDARLEADTRDGLEAVKDGVVELAVDLKDFGRWLCKPHEVDSGSEAEAIVEEREREVVTLELFEEVDLLMDVSKGVAHHAGTLRRGAERNGEHNQVVEVEELEGID